MRLGSVIVTLFCVSAPVKADSAFQGRVLRVVTVLTPSSLVVGTLLKVDAAEVTVLLHDGEPATMPVRWRTAHEGAQQRGKLTSGEEVVLTPQGELVEVTQDGARLCLAEVLRGPAEGEALTRFARQPDLRRQLTACLHDFHRALPNDSTFAAVSADALTTTAGIPGLLRLAQAQLARACKPPLPSCATSIDDRLQATLSAAAKACRER